MEPIKILILQLKDMARSTIEIMPQLFISLVIILITFAFAKRV
ncbi:hypothetical protein [Thiomicrorhabdus arctica]|nr:hypothetical protein [Thiomicrorhabdus arctica]